jgi:hypothetical protein
LTDSLVEHELGEYRAFSSILVERELEQVAEPHRTGYLNLVRPLDRLELVEEAAILARRLHFARHFSPQFMADAMHVALASIHKIDYLVTWNFGHLANVRKQARIRLFNTTAGFFSPVIVTPEFLVHS